MDIRWIKGVDSDRSSMFPVDNLPGIWNADPGASSA